MKRILGSAVFRVIISLSLIIILLYLMRGQYSEIASALKNINIWVFALGFAIFLLALGVSSCRFFLIIKAQGDSSVNFKYAASLTLIGMFFNNFLPTSIGGDLVKAYYLAHKTKDRIGSFASVLVDRLTGLITMIFIASTTLFFLQSSIISEDIRQVIYGVTAGALLLILFVINKTFAKSISGLLAFARPLTMKFKDAYYTIHRYKHNRGLIIKSLGISIISQLLLYLSFGTIAFSIGSKISAVDALIRIPLISLMSMLPSLNGLGLREGATVVLFGPLIGKDSAFAVSILWILAMLMTSVIGGIVYAISPQFRVKFHDLKKEAIK